MPCFDYSFFYIFNMAIITVHAPRLWSLVLLYIHNHELISHFNANQCESETNELMLFCKECVIFVYRSPSYHCGSFMIWFNKLVCYIRVVLGRYSDLLILLFATMQLWNSCINFINDVLILLLHSQRIQNEYISDIFKYKKTKCFSYNFCYCFSFIIINKNI